MTRDTMSNRPPWLPGVGRLPATTWGAGRDRTLLADLQSVPTDVTDYAVWLRGDGFVVVCRGSAARIRSNTGSDSGAGDADAGRRGKVH